MRKRARNTSFVTQRIIAFAVNTQKNAPVNLQHKRLLNSHENFTSTLHDFTCVLLSITTNQQYKMLKQK